MSTISNPDRTTLLTAGLIDEIRLVTPTVLGEGRRRLPAARPAPGLRVAEHAVAPGGITILVLEATGPVAFATGERDDSVDA